MLRRWAKAGAASVALSLTILFWPTAFLAHSQCTRIDPVAQRLRRRLRRLDVGACSPTTHDAARARRDGPPFRPRAGAPEPAEWGRLTPMVTLHRARCTASALNSSLENLLGLIDPPSRTSRRAIKGVHKPREAQFSPVDALLFDRRTLFGLTQNVQALLATPTWVLPISRWRDRCSSLARASFGGS
jgi:hypothetical protein